MVVTDYGKSGTALLFVAGSANPPAYFAIGTGSSTKTVSTSGLVTESGTRKAFTSIDLSAQKNVGFIGDYNSVEMSGVTLTEFAVFSDLTGGNAWSVEGINGIIFDGTNELQLEVTYEYF